MAKKGKCPEFENHERWLVSYADMVTLLFAVFVVLYSLNMAGEKNEDKAAGSMQESFNTPLEDIPIDRRAESNEQGFGIFEHLQGDSIRQPISPKFPVGEQRIRILEKEMAEAKKKLEERLYGPNAFRDSEQKGEARIVEVQKTEHGFKFQLLARYFYEPGSSIIKREARKELDEVVKILKEMGRRITVEGHTDSSPPVGQYSNWELSALRATSVVKYMIQYHNFPRSKLSAAGYADIRPIAHNGTAAGRALNRRIEIQVHYDEDSIEGG
jgi:chemotaxis protein MotB